MISILGFILLMAIVAVSIGVTIMLWHLLQQTLRAPEAIPITVAFCLFVAGVSTTFVIGSVALEVLKKIGT